MKDLDVKLCLFVDVLSWIFSVCLFFGLFFVAYNGEFNHSDSSLNIYSNIIIKILIVGLFYHSVRYPFYLKSIYSKRN